MGVANKDSNSVASLVAVSSLDGVTLIQLYADPVTHRLLVDNSGGGGITKMTATGIVNGINTAFTFASEPSYIVSDGAWYEKLDSNGGVNWTWTGGSLTATMTIPPTSAIFGVA